jgi:dihydrofolate synthase/folylpolyglutamate synthase
MPSQSISLYNLLAKKKQFKKTVNFDLRRIKYALTKIGNPEKKLKNVINIIGSDGKYSVLNSLKYFIEENKQTTSAYISPSLKDIKERFWMGSNYLSHNEIKNTINKIERLKIRLTIFEVLTLVYIINASKYDNDYNLVEAGALFAKDSTNVFDFPFIQAVVNINKQHLNFVEKKTINEIISQKVGFLSNFTNIYIGKQSPKNKKKIKSILKKNLSKKIYSNNWALIKKKKGLFFKDKNNFIPLKTKNVNSKGLFDNIAMAMKIALDIGINKKIISKALPKIKFEGRIQYIVTGKLRKKLNLNEKLLIDGCHSNISGKNLSDYLKTIKFPKYGIWSMMKNKDPSGFIKQFKGIFKKIYTIPIKGEKNSISPKLLAQIAKKNNIDVIPFKSFESVLKEISTKEKKIICIFGSLYQCGNILNKN